MRLITVYLPSSLDSSPTFPSSCGTTPPFSPSPFSPDSKRLFPHPDKSSSKDPSNKLTVKLPCPRSPIDGKPLPPNPMPHSPNLGGSPGDMYTIFEEEGYRTRKNSLATSSFGVEGADKGDEKQCCPMALKPGRVGETVASDVRAGEDPSTSEEGRRQQSLQIGFESQNGGDKEEEKVGSSLDKVSSTPGIIKESHSSSLNTKTVSEVESSTPPSTSPPIPPPTPPPISLKFRRQRRAAVTRDTFEGGGRESSSSPPPAAPLVTKRHERATGTSTGTYMEPDPAMTEPLSEDEEVDSIMRSQSVPAPLLVSELHSLGQTSPPEPASSSPTGSPTRHQRKGSLPIHIQRVFPELASPVRPQSPLVLHEMRSSSPTTSPSRQGSLPNYHCHSMSEPVDSNTDFSDDEGGPVLCGIFSQSSFASLISPGSSPKRSHKSHSASPSPKRTLSPISSPSRRRQRLSECIRPSSNARKPSKWSEPSKPVPKSTDHTPPPAVEEHYNSHTPFKNPEVEGMENLPTASTTRRAEPGTSAEIQKGQGEMALTPSGEKGRPLYTRRRRAILGILQTLKTVVGPEAGVGAESSPCTDTAEISSLSKAIARELSDAVVYTETVRFTGFKTGIPSRCSEMHSVSEVVAKKAAKKTPLELLRFNSGNLFRVYPTATRINSSNYSPANYWMYGCQLVTLASEVTDSVNASSSIETRIVCTVVNILFTQQTSEAREADALVAIQAGATIFTG